MLNFHAKNAEKISLRPLRRPLRSLREMGLRDGLASVIPH